MPTDTPLSPGRILVSGATGFVGRALVRTLLERGVAVRAAVRRAGGVAANEEAVVGEIDGFTEWGQALSGVDAVVHLAARVHVMDDREEDPLASYRRANVAGTLRMAEAAAHAGARRFVFASSIKVNGETTLSGRPFTAEDRPAPADPYGVSKMEAEVGLLELARASGMEVTIVRPPLVYGPGVKANFEAMMKWLCRGVPLPLGAVNNRRSLVALDNLVDLLSLCTVHPGAANQVFLASDGEDLSTTSLLRRLSVALGVAPRLVPVPTFLLEAAARVLGRRSVAQRLCGNLQVDISKTRDLLGWQPPVAVDEALRQTARAFLEPRP